MRVMGLFSFATFAVLTSHHISNCNPCYFFMSTRRTTVLGCSACSVPDVCDQGHAKSAAKMTSSAVGA